MARPAGRRRAVTLHDVAREAGVAVSTVSRALSDPQRVNARTREHVSAVAQRLGYRPNRLAQALPTGRTGMLAVLVPDITNPHNFGLVRGAEAQARAAGSTLVIADTQESPELEAAHLDRLGSSVDGFVLASSRLTDADLHELAERFPVVLFNRRVEGLPSLATDSADGSRQIVEHLAALGHRSIAYLAGPSAAWSDGERWRALSAAAGAAGRGAALSGRCRGGRRGGGPMRPVPPDSRRRSRRRRHRAVHRRDGARGVQRPARDRGPPPPGRPRCRRARAGQRCRLRRHLRSGLLPSAPDDRGRSGRGGGARARRRPAGRPGPGGAPDPAPPL